MPRCCCCCPPCRCCSCSCCCRSWRCRSCYRCTSCAPSPPSRPSPFDPRRCRGPRPPSSSSKAYLEAVRLGRPGPDAQHRPARGSPSARAEPDRPAAWPHWRCCNAIQSVSPIQSAKRLSAPVRPGPQQPDPPAAPAHPATPCDASRRWAPHGLAGVVVCSAAQPSQARSGAKRPPVAMHADKATTQPAPRALRVAAASALLSLLLATLAAPAHCQAPAAPAGPAAPASGAAGPAGPAGRPRGRLLKVPKVYNALITSNEPLLPSRTEQATVGQVLYYPPQHHHGYPASSGPLILPQVAAQAPPLLGPGGPGGPAQQPPQPLVSLPALPPQQQPGPADPGLELHLQGGTERADHNAEQATPWPVVYASDVQAEQDTQRYTAGDFDQSLVLQQYSTGDASQPQALQRYPNEQAGQSEQQALQRYTADQSAAVGQPEAAQPPVFPAARAVQTVERVAEPGQYRPPPTVDIDSIKNNRPVGTGIRDVPPPPLPVGRGRKPPMGPQPLPPGILPF